jgi:hypothetical protein
MTTRTKLIIVLCAIVLGVIALLLIKPPPQKVRQPVKLEMRVFKVDALNAHSFSAAFKTNTDPSKALSSLLGVDLTAPGRSVVFNDKSDMLFVKTTPSELDKVVRAIMALDEVAPQIHIKARFIEAPESDVESVLKAGVAVDAKETNTVEIVTADKIKALLRQLESSSGVMTLCEPEAVTTSGRQTQMRSDNSTVDLHPWLLSDSYTFYFDATVHALETMAAQANFWDGQTLALVSPDSNGTNRLVVFITATVIDSAGNRVYSEKKLPFNPATIPPQSKISTPSP